MDLKWYQQSIQNDQLSTFIDIRKGICISIFEFVFVFNEFLYLFSSYTFGPAEVSYSPIRRSIYDTRISWSRLCRSGRPRGLISYSSGRFNHPGAPIIRQALTQSKPWAPNISARSFYRMYDVVHQENIQVLLSRSGSHADRFKASSCEWSERRGDNSRTIRNKRNGGAAGPLESRASEKGEKRMTALGIGAYWSNWWLVQIRRRPPWECQTFPITN